MNRKKSVLAFKRANEIIPGGVNSPVRAFNSVKSCPVFIKKADGSKIIDIDDNTYIDYVLSWGPLLLGHAHKEIINAIKTAADNGTSYGAPTENETLMAELITQMVPSVEMVRMVNSGTEATMSAIRLARAFTKKNKIIKFAGCYHGHGDSFLIKAGSGAVTFGLPDSPGVTEGTAKDTLIAEYNNFNSVEKLFNENKQTIAAVIIEPVAGNMGVVLPAPNFLSSLREITKQNHSLLIFDEVITGFRFEKGGAQKHFGIIPDITTLGKIIGGGLPVGAYGGKKEIMEYLAPVGPVYQAGTLSGNPLAMTAGIATLKHIQENANLYHDLEHKANTLEKGIKENLRTCGIGGVINRIGSMMTLFFTNIEKVETFNDAMTADTNRYASYFNYSLDSGIYLAPSQFECMFLSTAHSDEDIEKTLECNYTALKKIS